MSILKPCPYAEKCYRRNPIHFSEFSHPHLDDIYERGVDPITNKYSIPSELICQSELLLDQLRLLETLFPKTEKSDTSEKNNQQKKLKNTNVRAQEKNVKSSNETTDQLPIYFPESSSHLSKTTKIERNIRDYIPVVQEKGGMARKLEAAAPYNFFLTAITDSKETHKESLTITFQEILDKSLGEIESSVQINFMVDIAWLLGHYYFAEIIHMPLLILYGDESPDIEMISKQRSNITAIKVNMPISFGVSHSKIMLLGYKDGSMRVVISTANLYEDDWHNRTQGVWLSPCLLPLCEDADTTAGESPTNFRQDLMLYLVEYKIAKLQPWLARIRRTDFSAINVFFIGSVPGSHREGLRGHSWGHARVSSLLKKHCTFVDEKNPIVCQSSSIGSLGPNIEAWIQSNILNSFRCDSIPLGVRQLPNFKMIYPSVSNVLASHDGMLGGGCLPYCKSNDDKQQWLKSYLYHWSSKNRYRSQAIPHIKTYTRFNLNENCIYWFLLTSANLSKAAWGSFNKYTTLQPSLRIFNYEAGILFLPRFVIGEETFPLYGKRGSVPAFPLPYDVPLIPYATNDKPFLIDYLS